MPKFLGLLDVFKRIPPANKVLSREAVAEATEKRAVSAQRHFARANELLHQYETKRDSFVRLSVPNDSPSKSAKKAG